jgi:peptide/nickel transport system permease protein
MTLVETGHSATHPQGRPAAPGRRSRPIRDLLVRRLALGVLSVFIVSVLVYFATLVLPGDAATAILGQSATPQRVAALRAQLGLNQPAVLGYWRWLTGFVSGSFGHSLADGRAVLDVVSPRIVNSTVLVLLTVVVSTLVGVVTGAWAAFRKDRPVDDIMSVIALGASALPEFVVGVFVILVFSVKVFKWFPAVSIIPPGTTILAYPDKLVLPVLTLVIVVTPYVFRMVRAATVETVFNYPGIGLTLVAAVTNRDVPVIQFLVVVLAIIYVVLNILTDTAVLMVTPRRRLPRG